MLFCLENDGCPAGILPRAFSDIPRSCNGTLSSAVDEIDCLREVWTEAESCAGVCGPSPSSSESSPPMAKGLLFSSGMRPRGDRAPDERRGSSSEAERTGLATASRFSAFLRSFCRSISCWPLSRVNSRTASKRLLYLRMAYTRNGFSMIVSAFDR